MLVSIAQGELRATVLIPEQPTSSRRIAKASAVNMVCTALRVERVRIRQIAADPRQNDQQAAALMRRQG